MVGREDEAGGCQCDEVFKWLQLLEYPFIAMGQPLDNAIDEVLEVLPRLPLYLDFVIGLGFSVEEAQVWAVGFVVRRHRDS